MGQELSTVGGAIATAATSVAAGVTFGQVDALNNAVVDCAKFTADSAENTTVRHIGETVGVAVATGATAVAAGVTFGQVDALNNAIVDCARHTGRSAVISGYKIVDTANDVSNGIPGVGHVKGAIHYACGDTKGGDDAMKSSSRTTGVLIGGAVGIVGGPAGMVAGGIAGGAAMDGITTGVESAIVGKYTPSGQIRAWTDVADGKSAQIVVGGVVGGLMTPVMDGVGGYKAGKQYMKARQNTEITQARNQYEANRIHFDNIEEVPLSRGPVGTGQRRSSYASFKSETGHLNKPRGDFELFPEGRAWDNMPPKRAVPGTGRKGKSKEYIGGAANKPHIHPYGTDGGHIKIGNSEYRFGHPRQSIVSSLDNLRDGRAVVAGRNLRNGAEYLTEIDNYIRVFERLQQRGLSQT